MTIRHHLSDQLLMAYAAGDLPEAFNLVVATHVSLCDECRAQLASFEAVGGAMLESNDVAEMSDDSLAACMDRISSLSQATARQPIRRARRHRRCRWSAGGCRCPPRRGCAA